MIKKLALALFLAATSAAFATTYSGNAATGFGGTIGGGSLTLTNSGNTVSGTITTGGAFNDGFVIYIDSISGANATQISSAAGFTDSADTNRGAITDRGLNTVNLPIAADFALALSPAQGTFGGLWSLTNGANLPFIASANLLPLNATAGTYTFSFNLSDIGLTPGQSFNFVTTYLNGSNAFLSNETLNGTTGLGAANPGTPSTVTLSGFQTFTSTAVPEPATVLLVGPALLGGMFFVRRRRA